MIMGYTIQDILLYMKVTMMLIRYYVVLEGYSDAKKISYVKD